MYQNPNNQLVTLIYTKVHKFSKEAAASSFNLYKNKESCVFSNTIKAQRGQNKPEIEA